MAELQTLLAQAPARACEMIIAQLQAQHPAASEAALLQCAAAVNAGQISAKQAVQCISAAWPSAPVATLPLLAAGAAELGVGLSSMLIRMLSSRPEAAPELLDAVRGALKRDEGGGEAWRALRPFFAAALLLEAAGPAAADSRQQLHSLLARSAAFGVDANAAALVGLLHSYALTPAQRPWVLFAVEELARGVSTPNAAWRLAEALLALADKLSTLGYSPLPAIRALSTGNVLALAARSEQASAAGSGGPSRAVVCVACLALRLLRDSTKAALSELLEWATTFLEALAKAGVSSPSAPAQALLVVCLLQVANKSDGHARLSAALTRVLEIAFPGCAAATDLATSQPMEDSPHAPFRLALSGYERLHAEWASGGGERDRTAEHSHRHACNAADLSFEAAVMCAPLLRPSATRDASLQALTEEMRRSKQPQLAEVLLSTSVYVMSIDADATFAAELLHTVLPAVAAQSGQMRAVALAVAESMFKADAAVGFVLLSRLQISPPPEMLTDGINAALRDGAGKRGTKFADGTRSVPKATRIAAAIAVREICERASVHGMQLAAALSEGIADECAEVAVPCIAGLCALCDDGSLSFRSVHTLAERTRFGAMPSVGVEAAPDSHLPSLMRLLGALSGELEGLDTEQSKEYIDLTMPVVKLIAAHANHSDVDVREAAIYSLALLVAVAADQVGMALCGGPVEVPENEDVAAAEKRLQSYRTKLSTVVDGILRDDSVRDAADELAITLLSYQRRHCSRYIGGSASSGPRTSALRGAGAAAPEERKRARSRAGWLMKNFAGVMHGTSKVPKSAQHGIVYSQLWAFTGPPTPQPEPAAKAQAFVSAMLFLLNDIDVHICPWVAWPHVADGWVAFVSRALPAVIDGQRSAGLPSAECTAAGVDILHRMCIAAVASGVPTRAANGTLAVGALAAAIGGSKALVLVEQLSGWIGSSEGADLRSGAALGLAHAMRSLRVELASQAKAATALLLRVVCDESEIDEVRFAAALSCGIATCRAPFWGRPEEYEPEPPCDSATLLKVAHALLQLAQGHEVAAITSAAALEPLGPETVIDSGKPLVGFGAALGLAAMLPSVAVNLPDLCAWLFQTTKNWLNEGRCSAPHLTQLRAGAAIAHAAAATECLRLQLIGRSDTDFICALAARRPTGAPKAEAQVALSIAHAAVLDALAQYSDDPNVEQALKTFGSNPKTAPKTAALMQLGGGGAFPCPSAGTSHRTGVPNAVVETVADMLQPRMLKDPDPTIRLLAATGMALSVTARSVATPPAADAVDVSAPVAASGAQDAQVLPVGLDFASMLLASIRAAAAGDELTATRLRCLASASAIPPEVFWEPSVLGKLLREPKGGVTYETAGLLASLLSEGCTQSAVVSTLQDLVSEPGRFDALEHETQLRFLEMMPDIVRHFPLTQARQCVALCTQTFESAAQRVLRAPILEAVHGCLAQPGGLSGAIEESMNRCAQSLLQTLLRLPMNDDTPAAMLALLDAGSLLASALPPDTSAALLEAAQSCDLLPLLRLVISGDEQKHFRALKQSLVTPTTSRLPLIRTVYVREACKQPATKQIAAAIDAIETMAAATSASAALRFACEALMVACGVDVGLMVGGGKVDVSTLPALVDALGAHLAAQRDYTGAEGTDFEFQRLVACVSVALGGCDGACKELLLLSTLAMQARQPGSVTAPTASLLEKWN